MVKYRKGMTYVRKAMFLTILMFFMTLAPLAAGADYDGDGFDDSVDDCRWAYGTSSIDKDGCPDRDGDGTSDINDKWTTNNPNFQNEFTISSNQDYLDVDYSPDGEFVTTASENGFVRIWNASTHVNIRSVLAHSNNGEVTSVSYSPDGMYVAAGLDDDTMDIYYSSNLTSVHGSISVDVGSGDYVYDVEFSPDSTLVAVSIGRSGNGGTNGQVKLIKVSDGLQLGNGLNPNSEDRFEDAAFSPGGEYIALASDDDFYIVDIATRATTYSVSSPPANVNAIAWSPDGNYIAMCGGWEGNQASFDMYEFSGSSWTLIWQKTTTTSCASTDFSYDSSQVVAGMYWYLGDANSGVVYDSDSGVEIDRFNGPRPGGCGGNDGCGQMNGIAWSPDSTHIVTAHGRGD